MGADEAPHQEEEREEVVEIHPPIPPDEEEDERDVRWEQIDPEELIYPPLPAAVNILDLIADDAELAPQMRQEALGLLNQYLHLRGQLQLQDNQLPLIIQEGRIIANPDFNLDAFRIGGRDEN